MGLISAARVRRIGEYQYGFVLALVTGVSVLAVLAPDGRLSRGLVAGLLGFVLMVVVITGNLGLELRRLLIAILAVLLVGAGGLIVAGEERYWFSNAVAAVLIVAIVVELVRGLVAMLGKHGVNLAAVAGGLSIYLLIGLFFATVIGVVADFSSQPYFTDGRIAEMSERTYFSFTTMTTTGFGDPAVATRPGKSLAVLEMLIGQIYLVTVIALLVGRARTG